VRRCLADYSARISFAVVSLYTATGLLVAMLWQGDYTAVAALSGKNWLLLIASAVVGIAVTHVALYRALQQIGALSCTGGLNLSPVIALVLAWVFLGETMTSTQYGGAIYLLVAVTALLYAQATVKEKSSEPSA
jgi:drug/metabolite transporter (DMT)-like permease